MSKLKKLLKYLTSPDYRFLIDSSHGKHNDLPDAEYLKRRYKAFTGKELPLEDPKTFNENTDLVGMGCFIAVS